MQEHLTKRGKITFGTEKVMIEESIKAYFTNSFKGFWKDGDVNEKIFFLTMTGLLSFSISFILASFFFAPLDIQLDIAVLFITLALAVMIYEHWNKVDREKFIPYKSINYVEYVEGIDYLTCPRFLIKYSKNDEEKTRYVVMPSNFMPETEENIEEIKQEFEDRDIQIL